MSETMSNACDLVALELAVDVALHVAVAISQYTGLSGLIAPRTARVSGVCWAQRAGFQLFVTFIEQSFLP